MDKKSFFKWLDIIICSAVILSGFIIIIVDSFFQKEIDYAWFCFAYLTLISSHFLISVFSQDGFAKIVGEKLEEKLNSSLRDTVNSLGGIEKRIFTTAREADRYIAERIAMAESQIYDLNWQDNYWQDSHWQNNTYDARSSEEWEEDQEIIGRSIKKFCLSRKKDKPQSFYKEIFTFPNKADTRIETMCEHLGYGEKYRCAYFDYDYTKNKQGFPKLQFVIIDKKEVIFVSRFYQPNLCAIRDEKIVSIFCLYFNQAWHLSTKIKDRDDPLIVEIKKNIANN
ncbi:MAG: hypothetical protein LBG19_11595 [Prevotellaceae bacterium]|jgi:hypothetical protein|nr:hypothetical protein [Prevotellaceae bacterium]